jgi:hypothetical protein
MKKILYSVLGLVAYVSGFSQNIEFSDEIKPSFDNSTVKLDPRLFSGDYTSTSDNLDVLAISADCTVFDANTKLFAPIKGNISDVFVIQDGTIGASKQDSVATVFATLDKNQKDAVTGDGGGVVFFKIQRTKAGPWKVVPSGKAPSGRLVYFSNSNFNTVGGTVGNKDFIYVGTAGNTTQRILVLEDASNIHSNKDLIGFSDTSNFVYPTAFTQETQSRSPIPKGTVVPKYQSLGWPVEIDALSGQVISKFHRLGRGVTAITNGDGNFYFTYGGNPSILVRYSPYGVINSFKKQDLPDGADPAIGGDGSIYLYAYKQNPDGTGGFSIPLASKIDSVSYLNPGDGSTVMVAKFTQSFDSLLIAKELALRAGATMFSNIGDLATSVDEYGYSILLISERGVDSSGNAYSDPSVKYNGKLALHLSKLDSADSNVDGKFNDPYGRVLVLNNLDQGGKITTLIEGGVTKNGGYFFSNPDKMELIQLNSYDANTNLFTIKESIPATDKGRNPNVVDFSKRVNEAYFATVSGQNGIFPLDDSGLLVKSLSFSDDFKLFESGSNGSELSSCRGYVSPGGGIFLTNSLIGGGSTYDTYLTVVNGYNGTDKSMILAVRNINTFTVGLFENAFLGNQKRLAAWPNPSKGHLTTSVVSDYSITDLSGQSLKSFSQTNELDISELEKGMYILKMTSTGSTTKIVLE